MQNDTNTWARRAVRAMLKRISLALLAEAVSLTAAAERIRGLR
jgi:hypothetical protein